MTDADHQFDGRTRDDVRRDLMLAVDHDDLACEALLERQLLGVVLAHGEALRDTVISAMIPIECFVGARHRMVWACVSTTTSIDEWFPCVGSVTLLLENQGLDPDGFEEQYLDGLAQADAALAAASGRNESPRERFIRLATSLLDHAKRRRMTELHRTISGLQRLSALRGRRALHRLAKPRREVDQ